jgi:hypothetical protein
VDEFLNVSVAETFISISSCDSYLISQGDWGIRSDPEMDLLLNLLCLDLLCNPFLLQIAKKLRNHIPNV